MPKQQRRQGTVPNEQRLDDILSRKPRQKDDSLWVVKSRDGDYIEAIEATDWDTVKWQFYWTPHLDFAQVFTGQELLGKDGTMNLVVMGFPGSNAIKIKEGTKQHADRV